MNLIEDYHLKTLPFGTIGTKRWYFDGIRIKHLAGKYERNEPLPWNAPPNTLTLYFNIKGKAALHVKGFPQPVALGNGCGHIFYTPHFEGVLLNEELHSEAFIIHFDSKVFLELTTNLTGTAKNFIEKLLAYQRTMYTGPGILMDAALLNAINDILLCRFDDGLKSLFLRTKSVEILTRAIDAYIKAESAPAIHCKTEYDRERILFARDYLLQRITMPPSITELARIAGINEFKLKNGFKEVFGNTIFGYLAEHRLQLALQQIQQGKKPVTTIAFELGYSSLQHFSKAYKTKFGVSPRPAKKI